MLFIHSIGRLLGAIGLVPPLGMGCHRDNCLFTLSGTNLLKRYVGVMTSHENVKTSTGCVRRRLLTAHEMS